MTKTQRKHYESQADPDCTDCGGEGTVGGYDPDDPNDYPCECLGGDAYEENPRVKGDDDGQEYGHPDDYRRGLE